MGGRNGYPDFSNGDAFGGPEYFEDIEVWADGLFGETYPTPTDLPSSGVPDGRLAFVQSNKSVYVQSGGWQVYGGVPVVASVFTFGSGYSFGAGSSSRVTKRGTVVMMNLQVTRTSDFALNDVAFTLPVGFRPYADTLITGTITTGANQGFIGWSISASTGTVSVNWYTSPGGHPRTAWCVGSFEVL